MPKILLLGVGNEIMSDDGLGVLALRQLQRKINDPTLIFLEQGISFVFDETAFQQAKKIIILDALMGGDKPGTIYKVPLSQLKLHYESISSLHQWHILHQLSWDEQHRNKTIILGMEPQSIVLGTDLSDTVKNNMDNYLLAVEREIIFAKELNS